MHVSFQGQYYAFVLWQTHLVIVAKLLHECLDFV